MSAAARPAAWLLLAYSVLLAVALLAPTSSVQSHMVMWSSRELRGLGVPWRWVVFQRMEVIMNALIIAPVTFLGSIWRPRLSWRDWTAGGFVLSSLVELAQAFLLPHRDPQMSDVVANTAGALLGALVAAGVFAVARLVRPRRWA